MKIIILIIILLSLNFIFIKHPLSIGFILLLQTILSSILCRFNMSSYIFSYILFLIFIGGILILFIYISRIASNEKFFFSIKLILINILLIFIIYKYFIIINLTKNIISSIINLINDQDILFISKIFSFPSGKIILIIVIYLLFTLIAIVNIVKLKIAPLRRS